MGHVENLRVRERRERRVENVSLCTYLFCAAATYKKFIEAIVCVADYLQYVHSHRSSVHINYFGTGPKATDCDAGTGMWTGGRADIQAGNRTNTHNYTLAQLTSQFSAHNARKCQDPSENGDEEEDEDEDETGR